ncbi:LysM peptidoglycan-binding domain-containing protein [Vagococcus lutrae]
MYRAAINAGISQEKLAELNGISMDAALQPGQVLRTQ